MKIIAIAMVALICSLPAAAQPMGGICAPYDVISKRLADVGESLVGRGVAGRGQALVEIYISETGVFTIITRRATGKTCLILWGRDWVPSKPTYGKPT